MESAFDMMPEELWEMIFEFAMASDKPFYLSPSDKILSSRLHIPRVCRSWHVSVERSHCIRHC